MSGIQRSGRIAASRNVRIAPEFREKPDVEKLARALLAVANKTAEKEKPANREGDAVA